MVLHVSAQHHQDNKPPHLLGLPVKVIAQIVDWRKAPSLEQMRAGVSARDDSVSVVNLFLYCKGHSGHKGMLGRHAASRWRVPLSRCPGDLLTFSFDSVPRMSMLGSFAMLRKTSMQWKFSCGPPHTGQARQYHQQKDLPLLRTDVTRPTQQNSKR